ncbi:signal recognition particle subunit SRP54 [Constrictibacter sp. MBR-5]|uniref:signal recognition particle protein n=1 Tax=Constrictibacter sp. MBR-5 TaxID=3156467 RepID=UPI00339552BB
MFESLQERLTGVFDKLRRRGSLSESDVDAALREVRVALLEADVALPVVKDFIDQVRSKAVGQQVLRSVTPGQQVVKIVHDHLVEFLGKDPQDLSLRAAAPVPILMVGLQGSGKTTSTGKIALRLKDREKKKVLMASVDIHRPAAQEQLAQIGRQIGVATLPVVFGELPVAIARRAMETGRREGYDVVFVDTAGRLGIDEKMMQEAIAVRDAINPHETLLVADAMTGQDAVNVAKAFNERIGVTGIMLTRVDGDARGGAALSMRAVTGKPLKFLGVGEKMDAIEAFHPDRIAGRILGMGDVVSLVERAAETIEQEDAEKLARKMQKGQMDLEDMLSQLRQVKKMGGLGGIMKMLPGVGKMQKQLAGANIDEKMIGRQEAIILSMTKKERARPDLIKASRKQRIAAGSGSTVQEVNRLLKQFQQMQSVMKKVGKMDKTSLMRSGLGGLMGGGGMGGMGGPGGQGGPFGPRGMR